MLGHQAKRRLVPWPVVQSLWIKVGPVRPDQRARLSVDPDLLEHRCIVFVSIELNAKAKFV